MALTVVVRTGMDGGYVFILLEHSNRTILPRSVGQGRGGIFLGSCFDSALCQRISEYQT